MTLLWGFWINWLIVKNIDPVSILRLNPFALFIGYVAMAFFGVYLFNKSDNPLISFLGYNLVVIPFGLVINIVVSQYDPAIVLEAVRVTGMVTAGMMFLGTLFPSFFKKIIGALSIALLLVIVIEVIEIVFFKMHHGFLDWIVVMIFCGYIGYDWARANSIPKTVDNAVDSAAALYMDIINLFLRILRILGRR
jgi:FtsH-binding integral membrane protein